jgi:hypothetical protein
MGLDGLAMCDDNEADGTFFDEYNFKGLLNEPWYDQMDGKEIRSLFQPKIKHIKPLRRIMTPDSLKKERTSSEGE